VEEQVARIGRGYADWLAQSSLPELLMVGERVRSYAGGCCTLPHVAEPADREGLIRV
jgi:hypothetical protein